MHGVWGVHWMRLGVRAVQHVGESLPGVEGLDGVLLAVREGQVSEQRLGEGRVAAR